MKRDGRIIIILLLIGFFLGFLPPLGNIILGLYEYNLTLNLTLSPDAYLKIDGVAVKTESPERLSLLLTRGKHELEIWDNQTRLLKLDIPLEHEERGKYALEVRQEIAEIGKPVKWEGRVKADGKATFTLPFYAFNITLDGEPAGRIISFSGTRQISFFTPPPILKKNGSRIRIYSTIPYNRIKASLQIEESFPSDISLIGPVSRTRYLDRNGNGLIDGIEWEVERIDTYADFYLNLTPKKERRVLVTGADESDLQELGLEGKRVPALKAWVVRLPAEKTRELLERAKRIEEDLKLQVLLQDSLGIVGADRVHKIEMEGQNITGKGLSVCIVDTGISPHPDFSGRILAQHCFADDENPGDGIGYCPNGGEEDTNATDDNGHGTRVAGIVAANGGLKGMAPEVGIVAVKVCNSQGNCWASDIAKGIEWCREHKEDYNISVITMSLGTRDVFSDPQTCANLTNQTITPAANLAWKEGIFLDAASGNSWSTIGISNPACLENVTSVAASSKEDRIAPYSNVHEELLDLVAPGDKINSTTLSGYGEGSGTSFAAPHVAGAAVLLQQYSKLKNDYFFEPEEIRLLLKRTGKPVPDDVYADRSGLYFPRIDIYNAVTAIPQFNGSAIKNENASVSFGQPVNYNFISYCFLLERNNLTLLSEDVCKRFNTSARIELYNLSFTHTPVVMKDGRICTNCQIVSYENATLVFDVQGFSSYWAENNSKLEIWTDGGRAYEWIGFYANFTNRSSGQSIASGDCWLELNGSHQMDFNSTTGLFETRINFTEPGYYNFTIRCQADGFENASESGQVFVYPRAIYVCDFCQFSQLSDALSFANSTDFQIILNQSDRSYSLPKTAYNLSSRFSFPAILIKGENISIDCNSSLIFQEGKKGKGIRIEAWADVRGCWISGYQTGIEIVNSSARISGCNLTENGKGIFALDSDLILETNRFQGNGLDVSKEWQVQAYVFTNDGPVAQAEVRAEDENGSLFYQTLTAEDGYTEIFSLPEFRINQSFRQNFTRFKISAFKNMVGNYDLWIKPNQSYVPLRMNLSQCIKLRAMTIGESARICRGNYMLSRKAGLTQVVIINGNDLVVDCDFSNLSLSPELKKEESSWGLWFFYTVGKNVTLKNCLFNNTLYPVSTGSSCQDHSYINNRIPGLEASLQCAGNLSVLNNLIEGNSMILYIHSDNLTFSGNNFSNGKIIFGNTKGVMKNNTFYLVTIRDAGPEMLITRNTFEKCSFEHYTRATLTENNFTGCNAVIGDRIENNTFINSKIADYYSNTYRNISHNLFTNYSGQGYAIELNPPAFIFNNTIQDAWIGMEINKNTTVVLNRIQAETGIKTWRDGTNNTIFRNNLTGETCMNIYTTRSGLNNLSENQLECDWGIKFWQDAVISKNKIENASVAIFGQNGQANISNNTISGAEEGIWLSDILYNPDILSENQIGQTKNNTKLRVNWTLTVLIKDQLGNLIKNSSLNISSERLNLSFFLRRGRLSESLPEYEINNSDSRLNFSPYLLKAGFKTAKNQSEIWLDSQKTITLILNLTPKPNFTWSPESPVEGENVSFADLSETFYQTEWLWEFGDGESSMEQNPSHLYQQNGTYQVCLNLTDSYNVSSLLCKTINISDSVPLPDFTWSGHETGKPITFDASPTESWDQIVNYSWDFGDGNKLNSTQPRVQHTYNTEGSYLVILTVKDSDGSIANISKILTVSKPRRPSGWGGGGGAGAPAPPEEKPVIEPKSYRFQDISGKEIFLNLSDSVQLNRTLIVLRETKNLTAVLEVNGSEVEIGIGQNELDLDRDGEADLLVEVKAILDSGIIAVFSPIAKAPEIQPVQPEVPEAPAIPIIPWGIFLAVFAVISGILILLALRV